MSTFAGSDSDPAFDAGANTADVETVAPSTAPVDGWLTVQLAASRKLTRSASAFPPTSPPSSTSAPAEPSSQAVWTTADEVRASCEPSARTSTWSRVAAVKSYVAVHVAVGSDGVSGTSATVLSGPGAAP